MVCTNCGAQILDHAFACPECARPMRVREVLESPPTLAPVVNPTGVKGWLAFLVFYLLFLLPLGSGIVLVEQFRPLLTGAPMQNGGLLAIRIISAATILSVGLGIYAGTALWRIYPNAVAATKRFFVAFLISDVVISTVQYHSAVDRIWGIVDALAFCLFWYAYLNRSKRVANTYSHSSVLPA